MSHGQLSERVRLLRYVMGRSSRAGHPVKFTLHTGCQDERRLPVTADHSHATRNFGPAFAWAIGLNAAYVVVEAGFGFVSGSLALLADAAHNLTGVGGPLLAGGAVG